MAKTLYCIRHGRARHNEDVEVYGRDAYYRPENIDSGLVDKGIAQAKAVGASLADHLGGAEEVAAVDAVFTSSLSRALDTTKHIMAGFDAREGGAPPVYVLDILRGFPFGSFMMAQRRGRGELVARYPGYNFDGVPTEVDEPWFSHLNRPADGDSPYAALVKVDAEYRPVVPEGAPAGGVQLPESTDAFRARVRRIKEHLWAHPARNMAVVAHDDIFCMLFHDHPDNGDFKNCEFYTAKLDGELNITRG